MEPRPIGLFAPKHTERQILDFYHATEYLTNVADAQFARDSRARKQWLDDATTTFKHDPLGPKRVDCTNAKLFDRTLATRPTRQNQGGINLFPRTSSR